MGLKLNLELLCKKMKTGTAEIADLVGTTPRTLNKWNNGEGTKSLKLASKLMEVSKLKYNQLFIKDEESK